MSVYIYAINSMLIYCTIAIGFDISNFIFGARPFFFNTSTQAIPFFTMSWLILLFHKPFQNIFAQQEFVSLRRRVLELGVLMFVVSITYSYFHSATKGYDVNISGRIFQNEIGRYAHIAIFHFALYTGTFSQVFTDKLSTVSVPKGLAVFMSVFSQTLVIGGSIFFVAIYAYFAVFGSNQSPVMSQDSIYWAQASAAADEHEIATVKKTCAIMSKEEKDKFRDEYFYKLRNNFVGPRANAIFD